MSSALVVLSKLARLSNVDLPHTDRIARAIEVIDLEPGQCAFRQGEPQPYVHVVRSGLLKQYYTDVDGNTWIKSFTDEGVVFACLEALEGGLASFSSEAIEHSVVERLHFRHIHALAAEHPEWLKAMGVAYAALARIKVRRERDLLMLTAEQLYEQFVASSPALSERVPQKDLAGYIGVTPVGLNRIVKRCRMRQ
jgi:CRP-like cAMP-binding protein